MGGCAEKEVADSWAAIEKVFEDNYETRSKSPLPDFSRGVFVAPKTPRIDRGRAIR